MLSQHPTLGAHPDKSGWFHCVRIHIIVDERLPTGKFGYVDTFPSLESWTATIAMTESTAEGMAIDEELQESAGCTESQLHKAEES